MHCRRTGSLLLAALALATAATAAESTALADAAEHHDWAGVRTLLQRDAAGVNTPQVDGTTALRWGVYHDDAEAVRLLVRARANANAVNRYGVPPLALASTNGDAAIVTLLLEAGADANAALNGEETALMLAARAGNAGAVKALLTHGARVDARERVTGAAKYAFDIQLPGMLYAAALRSPHPHARVTRVDVSQAQGMPGVRAIFLASFLLQLTFQTFTTWFSLHGTERFGLRPEDVTIGMIAWAVGGVIGALPAGVIGSRFGRRNTMLLGFASMVVCLLALNRVTTLAQATPLLALASASWTLPTVTAYPLFVEPVARDRRGSLAAVFLLCMALGGGIGDPMNGAIFDLAGSYRPLFLLMAAYTALAFAAVLFIPRGTGEAAPTDVDSGLSRSTCR